MVHISKVTMFPLSKLPSKEVGREYYLSHLFLGHQLYQSTGLELNLISIAQLLVERRKKCFSNDFIFPDIMKKENILDTNVLGHSIL